MRAPLELTWAGLEWTFEEPRFFWALLAVVPLVALALSSRAWISPAARFGSSALRALLVGTLCLAGTGSSVVRPSERVCVSVLTDVSDSMEASSFEKGKALARELIEKKRDGDTVQWIAFGERAEDVSGELSGSGLDLAGARARVGVARTNLARALELAASAQSPDCEPRVAIVSDGQATRGDASAALANARCPEDGRGCGSSRAPSVTWVPVEERGAVDVSVVGFSLPGQVRVRERFDCVVRLRATGSARGRLLLRAPSGDKEQIFERSLELSSGDVSEVFSLEASVQGELEIEASWLPEVPDRFEENDRARIVAPILGPPSVLLVDSGQNEVEALKRALVAQSFEADVRSPRDVPPSQQQLEKYAFVILSDLPRGSLSPAVERTIEEVVRAGGGLLVASGARGRGGLRGSSLERILPLRAEGTDEERTAGVAMVLAIDRSGSMSGAPLEMAKAACRATLGTLEPSDLLEVIAFDSRPSRAVPMQPARLRASMDASIARIQAGGGTEILASLDMAYQDLLRARARKKHIVLLTDGNADTDGIYEVASAAFADGITVTSVGLGPGVNEALLRTIAEAGGGRYHAVADAAMLPRIFVREAELTMQEEAKQERFSIAVFEEASFLKGTGVSRAPLLRGVEPTRPRPFPARVLLGVDTGQPLLAEMPVGLGHTLVWTSDFKGAWATDFLRWGGFPKFIGQLVRAHQRSDSSEIWPLEVRFDDDELIASFDAQDDSGFDNSITSRLSVSRADTKEEAERKSLTAPFELKGPGHYEARVPLPELGSFFVRATHLSQKQARTASSFQAAVRPYPEEYVDLGRGRAGSGISTESDRALDVNALLEPPISRTKTRVELRDWLLSGAAILLALEVLMRRLGVRGAGRLTG